MGTKRRFKGTLDGSRGLVLKYYVDVKNNIVHIVDDSTEAILDEMLSNDLWYRILKECTISNIEEYVIYGYVLINGIMDTCRGYSFGFSEVSAEHKKMLTHKELSALVNI